MQLTVNGQLHQIPDDWQGESLLSILREQLGLVGTKFGCGAGLCGACTVLIGDQAKRSCLVSPNEVGRQVVTTIEGLAQGERLHPVQRAWLAESVPQCGFCQAGQIMSTVALLRNNRAPNEQQIVDALDGNLCRCGTQQRIRAAVKRAIAEGVSN